jgi:hypothetical protein
MPKLGSPIKRPTSNGGLCGDQEAVPQLVINRERLNKSGPLAASVPVKFMELRPSMCRWPIGDPKHMETFRFCGFRVLVWGYILQSAHRKSPRFKPPKDATYD